MRAGIARGRAAGLARWRSSAPASRSTSPTPRSAPGSSRGCAHLLGLDRADARPTSEDLFSAWRLFFERMAERGSGRRWSSRTSTGPTPALLDFIEYLLEWSRSYPIFVLTLARPGAARAPARPGAPAGATSTRSSSSRFPSDARDELLRGLVPGLPDELRGRDPRTRRGRAALRGRDGAHAARPWPARAARTGATASPDGSRHSRSPRRCTRSSRRGSTASTPAERRLLEDAAVLGKTFTRARARARCPGSAEDELEPLLASLVRKEILTVETDPRSPERGQYGFLQALVQKVAYDTLSRRDRKARHLAAAALPRGQLGRRRRGDRRGDRRPLPRGLPAAPDAEDAADDPGEGAASSSTRAGERAASLAANEEAQRYFEQAAELADEPRAEAELLERAGECGAGGRASSTRRAPTSSEAIALFEGSGERRTRPHVSPRGWASALLRPRAAATRRVERMEQAFAVLSADEPDERSRVRSRPSWRRLLLLPRRDRARERARRARARDRRGAPAARGRSRRRSNTKALVLEHRPARERVRSLREALEDRARARPHRRGPARLQQPRRPCSHSRDRFDEDDLDAARGRRRARAPPRRPPLGVEPERCEPRRATSARGRVGRGARAWPQETRRRSARTLGAIVLPGSSPCVAFTPNAASSTRHGACTRALADREGSTISRTRGYALLARGSAASRAKGGSAEAARCGAKAATSSSDRSRSERCGAAGGRGARGGVRARRHRRRSSELLGGWASSSAACDRPLSLQAHDARFRSAARGRERDDERRAEAGFRRAAARFRELGMPFWLAVVAARARRVAGRARADGGGRAAAGRGAGDLRAPRGAGRGSSGSSACGRPPR